ncbi:hypothetical protein CWO89_14525 [Bradyrhizobium sp. Leo170]|nr:hypothetical protein CWO89_14525 [Bradyrhizobium sp. Leo170]
MAPGKPQQNAFVESFNGQLRRVAQRDAVQLTWSCPRGPLALEG